MRHILVLGVLAGLAPLGIATASAQNQGPMIVERIHSGFLAAPDVKITEMDRKTSALVGGYAGWITDDTFFIGAGGYWLAHEHRDDREMAYGGLVVQWLARTRGPAAFGVKALFGGGEATMNETVFIGIPEVRWANGQIIVPPNTRSQVLRFRRGFAVAEPELLGLVRLSKHVKLTGGVGYRFAGTDHREDVGSVRLSGATGSLSLQIGGGS